jgi:hypothetical protein
MCFDWILVASKDFTAVIDINIGRYTYIPLFCNNKQAVYEDLKRNE